MTVQLSSRERNAIRYGSTVRKGEADAFRAFCEEHNLVVEEYDSTRSGGRWLSACNGKLKAFAPPATCDLAFEQGITVGRLC